VDDRFTRGDKRDVVAIAKRDRLAQRERVIRLVLKEGAVLAFIGSVLGLGGAYGVGKLMQSTLYDVPAFDPIAFAGVITVLLLAALLASVLPAWRASRVEPIKALRCD